MLPFHFKFALPCPHGRDEIFKYKAFFGNQQIYFKWYAVIFFFWLIRLVVQNRNIFMYIYSDRSLQSISYYYQMNKTLISFALKMCTDLYSILCIKFSNLFMKEFSHFQSLGLECWGQKATFNSQHLGIEMNVLHLFK